MNFSQFNFIYIEIKCYVVVVALVLVFVCLSVCLFCCD